MVQTFECTKASLRSSVMMTIRQTRGRCEEDSATYCLPLFSLGADSQMDSHGVEGRETDRQIEWSCLINLSFYFNLNKLLYKRMKSNSNCYWFLQKIIFLPWKYSYFNNRHDIQLNEWLQIIDVAAARDAPTLPEFGHWIQSTVRQSVNLEYINYTSLIIHGRQKEGCV